MKKFKFLILLILMNACSDELIKAKFIEIKDNLARFDIVNESNKDLGKITFEIRYLDVYNKVLLMDTVSYLMSTDVHSNKIPFLKANDKIFIIQKIPENCKSADIKIIEIHYIENN